MKSTVIILVLLVVLVSCRNKCTQPEQPSPISNAPIEFGATLILNTTSVENATYTWIGPNGFKSNLQNPTIQNANFSHEGVYSVTVKVDDCMSLPGNVTVSLKPLETPCNPDNNTGTYASLPTTYTIVSGYLNTLYNTYEVNASSTLDNMSIRFGTQNKPNKGIYTIINTEGNQIAQNQVRITRNVTIGTVTNVFNATSGDLYVTKSGNTLILTFCNINFVTTNTLLNHSGSARVVLE